MATRSKLTVLALLLTGGSLASFGATSSPAFDPGRIVAQGVELAEEEAHASPTRETDSIAGLSNAISGQCVIQQHRREVAGAPSLLESVPKDIFCPAWPLPGPLLNPW